MKKSQKVDEHINVYHFQNSFFVYKNQTLICHCLAIYSIWVDSITLYTHA